MTEWLDRIGRDEHGVLQLETPCLLAHAIFQNQILTDKNKQPVVVKIPRVPVEIIARSQKSGVVFSAQDPSTRIEYADSRRNRPSEVANEMKLRFENCLQDWEEGGYYASRQPED